MHDFSSDQINLIEQAFDNRSLIDSDEVRQLILSVVDALDQGRLRVAQPADGGWQVNQWVKKAVILYFPISGMQTSQAGPLEFYDKVPLKHDYADKQVRVVPHAVARYGSYIAKGTILMPSFVNIGAYVDEGTMVDTWATVGSCAQIGKGVHLSGGVGTLLF